MYLSSLTNVIQSESTTHKRETYVKVVLAPGWWRVGWGQSLNVHQRWRQTLRCIDNSPTVLCSEGPHILSGNFEPSNLDSLSLIGPLILLGLGWGLGWFATMARPCFPHLRESQASDANDIPFKMLWKFDLLTSYWWPSDAEHPAVMHITSCY